MFVFLFPWCAKSRFIFCSSIFINAEFSMSFHPEGWLIVIFVCWLMDGCSNLCVVILNYIITLPLISMFFNDDYSSIPFKSVILIGDTTSFYWIINPIDTCCGINNSYFTPYVYWWVNWSMKKETPFTHNRVIHSKNHNKVQG